MRRRLAALTVGLFCALAFPVQAQQPAATPEASGEPFSVFELRAGKSASREGCVAEPNAVWVEHAYGNECIRYYPSDGIENGPNKPKMAVFFFHGDHLDGTTPLGNYDKITPGSLTRAMQGNYNKYGVPFILIARPGVYGSSGNHSQRRRPKEFYSLNAAVDAIKQRYGFERVILAGQSGGSTAGGALLTLGRKDVACAVLGSGGYDVLELAEVKRAKLGYRSRRGCDVTNYCDPYNVIDHVDGVAADANRVVAIVGDPNDNNTVFPLQRKFAEAVRAAGHEVELIEAEGQGPDRHSMSHVTFRLAGACAAHVMAGKSDQPLRLASLARSTPHALTVPPASGFATIDDVAAVPVSDKGKPRYAHYLTLPKPKAFVVTEKGGWFFSSGNKDAMQQALGSCPAGMKCWLYAVDEQVVWKADTAERVATLQAAGAEVPSGE